ncbi:uncharacterized protein [Palaemon carinicauda]|uniref:uncharacterized protein n=1 Tax=Palaemon carinicauda TaxID=392227 RepID=UPI0035B67291
MPWKEKRKKEQEQDRQDATKGSRTLYDWMKPRVAVSTSEQVKEKEESWEDTQESEKSEAEDMEAYDEPNEADSLDNLEQQVAPQEPQTEARAEMPKVEEPFSMLPELQYPNDPALVVNYKICINESFIRLCNNYGPCQPVISYPKSIEGDSFQKKWYERNSWLEYSPRKDPMFCFSCRLFLNEEKYRGRVAGKSEGISRWRTASEKIKEPASSESHMIVFNVQSTTGEALEKEVISILNKNTLNIDDMRGQGYDGVANMSGIYNGLQSRLQRLNPKALYVHCHAHSLNLVLVESAKSRTQFVTFFSMVEKLYAFISNSSKRHAAFMEIQIAIYPEDIQLELKKLSDTRWACRESALRTTRKVIPALKQFLEEIVQKNPLMHQQGIPQYCC